MVIDEITLLRKKLENQIESKHKYDDIYKTSLKIDNLLIEYYKESKIKEKV